MSGGVEPRLRDLAVRIERLSIAPDEIARASLWLRATSPLYRLVGWRARIRTTALRALLAKLRSVADAAGSGADAAGSVTDTAESGRAAPTRDEVEKTAKALVVLRDAALEELETNVTAAERAAVLDARSAQGPIAGWLARIHEVVERAARAVAAPEDEARRAAAIEVDDDWMLRPLAVASKAKDLLRGVDAPGDAAGQPSAEASRSAGNATSSAGSATPSTNEKTPSAGDAASSAGDAALSANEDSPSAREEIASSAEGEGTPDERLVEIELAAIDRVLDAARAETAFLGRRRRLFEAARKLLLDASAALPLEPVATSARARFIADQIVLVNRWQAAGVSPDVALPHQAVTALARGERERLYATLQATFTMASFDGDVAMAARSKEALRRLDPRPDRTARDASTARSATELLGDATVGAVRDAYDAARRELAFRMSTPPAHDDDPAETEQRLARWSSYLHEDAVLATLSAAISVDGCFEVGGTLAPIRVQEESTRIRVVDHPTQDMVVVTSSDVTDLPNAIIDDPRGVILALAEGRLFARKYRKIETIRTARTRMTTEARIYVLDGSDSMLLGASGRASGARARMRDALLLAELSTLYRRVTEGGRGARVVLFYRYFTKALGEVTRVASAEEATRAMAEVVRTPRHGGTNIEAALLASFEQIREARSTDPDLARAQIVLVTDGEAAVDEEAILTAREREGDFRIGVSVVALGEENPVLRRLVARQRARGEPAFYHFVSDADLVQIATGQRASGAAVHEAATLSEQATSAALTQELTRIVDEMETLDRLRSEQIRAPSPDAMGTADAESRKAAGLSGAETEGDRAHREARARDERALTARFDAWFPATSTAAPPLEPPPEDDVEAAAVVLTTLSEIQSDLLGSPAERRADAIELLERLLPDARLSPARYRAVLSSRPPAIARAIDALRASTERTPTARSTPKSR
ncbi:MAG: vWA domain-containing protein [Polyangiaceae bacterium]